MTPQLQDDIVTVQLSNLTKGQKYVLAVVATSVFSTASHFPQLNVLATTYGDGETCFFVYIKTIHSTPICVYMRICVIGALSYTTGCVCYSQASCAVFSNLFARVSV